MGWKDEDLSKPQVLVECTYGYSHPGSAHLEDVSKRVEASVNASGGKAACFFTTDICDGIAQGHEGMNYSLLSREFLAGMVEIHAKAEGLDGMVLISSCDKSVPAHLMAAARLDLPTIHVPGGCMLPGPEMLTLEMVGSYYSLWKKGRVSEAELKLKQKQACPTCGACAFMGTACTMQVMSEALGLALPTSALIPVTSEDLGTLAEKSGERVVGLIEENLGPSKILKKEAFENAIMVHSAIGGSTNVVLHLAAIAREVGVKIGPKEFNDLQRDIPLLADVRPSGKYPSTFFRPAGGVYKIMREIGEHLCLDALTVTGKTVGENLRELEAEGYFEKSDGYLMEHGLRPEEIIRPLDAPVKRLGAIAVLQGNLAPEGAIVKQTAVDSAMFSHLGKARVFDREEDALKAVQDGRVKPGSTVIVRYEGPKACGMPEMFYLTEAIASDPELNQTTALVTDGRFSGASRGPCVAHVSPEAAEGGPIAVVEDGDLIKIDIKRRRLDIVDTRGKRLTESVIRKRLRRWKRPKTRYERGVLGVFTRLTTSAAKGAYIQVQE